MDDATRVRRLATIAAAAAALLAAGCATSPARTHVPAHVLLTDASRQLSRSTSVVIGIEMDVGGQQGPAAHTDLTMRTAPDQAMTADITETEPDGSVFAVMREILVNKVVYLSAKVFSPGVPQDVIMPWAAPGETWTAVPESKLNQASGNTQDASQAQLNPMLLFSTIFANISAAKDISVAGGQVIDGVPTTRLHGTYRDHGAVITFDLWVDATDRPRELRVSTPRPTPHRRASR